jgi:uncharacterized membrane protein YphA (DoxX/SURF4 family)
MNPKSASSDPVSPPPKTPATYRITRIVFLRLLAGVYFVAFLSLWVQIDGLIGEQGLLPARAFLERMRLADADALRHFPTLLWLHPTDGFLHILCGAGCVLALMAAAGAAQAPAFVLLWACYLSLVVAGQDFLSFQWDILLLEAGFLAIFFSPLQLLSRRSRDPEPSAIVRWLVWWLLFRLMFLSGLVKWTYGDTSWRDGTAMYYHYLSQPLPTWTSWYAYKLPEWFQRMSVWSMFFIEVIAPFGIFLGRWGRRIAFVLLMILQVLITATGNYGFFNLLAMTLCTSLLDDAVWRWVGRLVMWPIQVLRTKLRRSEPATPVIIPPNSPNHVQVRSQLSRREPLAWPVWVTAPVAVVLGVLTTMAGISTCSPAMWGWKWPEPLATLREWAEPYHSANDYGLFRVMTRGRPEAVIFGSRDGVVWKPYEFKWKPGDVRQGPAYCTPHMPRLDWQIWVPFLGNLSQNEWLLNLLLAMLQGRTEVLDLLGDNPFHDAPPRYVQILIFDYQFTRVEQRDRNGAWWRRDFLQYYGPVLELDEKGGQLKVAEVPSYAP